MTEELHGWGPSLAEIGRRKAETRGMGGEARLTRQHQRGRLNARERLDRLFDTGTFFEIGNLVGTTDDPPAPGDALVAGSATGFASSPARSGSRW
jgi:acetyl-CoA carboxylase carboxyltransferase component